MENPFKRLFRPEKQGQSDNLSLLTHDQLLARYSEAKEGFDREVRQL